MCQQRPRSAAKNDRISKANFAIEIWCGTSHADTKCCRKPQDQHEGKVW